MTNEQLWKLLTSEFKQIGELDEDMIHFTIPEERVDHANTTNQTNQPRSKQATVRCR